jgi:hypothetical protein
VVNGWPSNSSLSTGAIWAAVEALQVSVQSTPITWRVPGAAVTTFRAEQVLGGMWIDPGANHSLKLRAAARLVTTDAACSGSVRLYDMGPGSGAFSPWLVSSVPFVFAHVGESYVAEQTLVVQTIPTSNGLWSSARLYEVRAYLDTVTAGSSLSVLLAEIAVR